MTNDSAGQGLSTLQVEVQLRAAQDRLALLARSRSLAEGDILACLRETTEAACELLAVARSSVWIYDDSGSCIRCLDLHVLSDSSHDCGTELREAHFPAYFAALRDERTIAAVDAHSDPSTSEFSLPYLTPLGIGAMLDTPIRVGGRMIGVLCNEHLGQARGWSAVEEFVAGALAQHAAAAFLSSERQTAEEQLRLLAGELENAAK